MNSFKTSLDKYLTKGPDDSYSNYCEEICERFSDTFFEANEYWIMNNDSLCSTWMENLYKKEIIPSQAARIIERAYQIFQVQ